MRNAKNLKTIAVNNVTAKIGSTIIEEISQTMDYIKYNRLDGNREVREAHVKKLVKSFEEYGTAACRLVVVRTKTLSDDGNYQDFLIDGQHTREALSELGLPVNILIVELFNDTRQNLIKYMAMLNNTNKAWTPDGFIQAYAKLGIHEYKVLAEQRKETGLTPTDLVTIFLGKNVDESFKQGTATFINETNSYNLLEATMKIKPYIPNKSFTRRSFYSLCEDTWEYDKFANAIITHYKLLRKTNNKFSENESEFKSQLSYIYSRYKIRRKN